MIRTTNLTVFLAVLDFLLPGYAWIIASGLYKRLLSLEKVMLSFVLSICFSSIVTAALAFLTVDYLFISVAVSLVGSLVVIGGYLVKERRSLPKAHVIPLSTGSRMLDFSILAYAILIMGLFWSAPYYPTAQAPDLLTHTQLTNAILGGAGRSTLLHATFPTGLHFAAAIVSKLVDIGALQSLRLLVSTALLAIVPLTYLCARELFEERRTAAMTLLVALFALPVDAIHLIRTGTFPNLLSDVIILTNVWLAFRYIKQPNRSLALTLVFLGIGGAFIHSSFLIFLGVLWGATPFVYFLFRKQARNYLRAAASSTLGLAIFAIFVSFSFQENLQRISSAYFVVGGVSELRIVFAEFTRSVLNYLGPVNAVVMVCAALVVFKHRSLGSVFSLVWLVLMVPGAFLTGQAYRFIFFSMVPGSFLIGNMLAHTPPLPSAWKSPHLQRLRLGVMGLVLLLLILPGVFPNLAIEAYNPTRRAYQSAIYESMIWLEHSDCAVSRVASVGLWPDYQYLPTLTGIPYAGDFVKPPDDLLQKSTLLGFHCLAVNRSNQYSQSFADNSSFQKEHSNQIVVIYLIS